MADNSSVTISSLVAIFQSCFAGLGSETVSRYRRTIADFRTFAGTHHLDADPVSPVLLTDWTFDLLRRHLSTKTIVRHLNILNSLFRRASVKGLLQTVETPRTLARTIENDMPAMPPFLDEVLFSRCIATLRTHLHKPVPDSVVADMLLLSLFEGAMPVKDIAALRKRDAARFAGLSRRLVERNIDSARDFIFNLRQSYRTPRQVVAAVDDATRLLFHDKALPSDISADTMVQSLWAACAVRGGATASQALGSIGHSLPLAIPALCTPVSVTAADKATLSKSVATQIAHDMPRWYAMQLRRGFTFDQLQKEISGKFNPAPELYYPCETIKKRIGNKTVLAEQPFISRTVFFKTYPENIMPLFAQIGDKAWCYRLNATPGSPYAVISQADMQRFQAAVGIFTPDIEIHPLGDLTPRPGETVILIQAGYGNREARVEDIIQSATGTILFRVKLTTDYGYEWRAAVDPRQLQPLR